MYTHTFATCGHGIAKPHPSHTLPHTPPCLTDRPVDPSERIHTIATPPYPTPNAHPLYHPQTSRPQRAPPVHTHRRDPLVSSARAAVWGEDVWTGG